MLAKVTACDLPPKRTCRPCWKQGQAEAVLAERTMPHFMRRLRAITEKGLHREVCHQCTEPISPPGSAEAFPGQWWQHHQHRLIASENPVPNSSLYSATKGAIDIDREGVGDGTGPRNIG